MKTAVYKANSTFILIASLLVNAQDPGTDQPLQHEERVKAETFFSTPLGADVRKSLNATIEADSVASAQKIAASVLYLSQILNEWNPRFSREVIGRHLARRP